MALAKSIGERQTIYLLVNMRVTADKKSLKHGNSHYYSTIVIPLSLPPLRKHYYRLATRM